MSTGIRKGCPIAAILYLFVADILALKIKKKNNDEILEIKPGYHSKEVKHIQHADNLTFFFRNRKFLKEALKTNKDFSKYAGYKLNIDKTECILTGCFKSCRNDIFGIKINTSFIKCLGIYFGHNKDECYKKHWIDKCESMRKLYES